jgi:hypothetical protein
MRDIELHHLLKKMQFSRAQLAHCLVRTSPAQAVQAGAPLKSMRLRKWAAPVSLILGAAALLRMRR